MTLLFPIPQAMPHTVQYIGLTVPLTLHNPGRSRRRRLRGPFLGHGGPKLVPRRAKGPPLLKYAPSYSD